MARETAYHAIIDKVVTNGKHGPYAVARSDELGVITFSLDPKVWEEKRWPTSGTCVVLSQVTKKRAGWRAEQGRFFRPSDQQPATSKERKP